MSEKHSWIVRAVVQSVKEYVLDGCTEAEASDPDKMMGFVVDERDIETLDWEIKSVENND